jgi:hypothetical protein
VDHSFGGYEGGDDAVDGDHGGSGGVEGVGGYAVDRGVGGAFLVGHGGVADLPLVEVVEAEQAAGTDAGGDDSAAVRERPVVGVGVGGRVDVDDAVPGGQVGQVEPGCVVVQAAKDEIDAGQRVDGVRVGEGGAGC